MLVAAVVALLSACSPTLVSIEEHEMSSEESAACAALVDDLPDTLADQLRRSVDPDDAPGAAWGDPAYVLTCGVPAPRDVPDTAACIDVGHDVGWYVPEEQVKEPRVDAVATTLTHTPRLELEVPARYRRKGFDSALAELAPLVEEHLTLGEPCF